METVELLYQSEAQLGEGPAWEARTQTLYWVDILGKRVHLFQHGKDEFIQLDEMVGCLAPAKDGGLILALRNSFAQLELATGKLTQLLALQDEPSGNRFNDGKCDPAGRFLAGTMDHDEKEACGSLYTLDLLGNCRRLLSGLRISNGLAWSPDFRSFYYIDTPTRQVQAFDYDLESGEIAYPRTAIRVPEALGWPDGMTSDLQGHLWISLWGGAQVTCWNPATGNLLHSVPVPALQCSSCVFGGPDMSDLYITSARVGLDQAALARYPLSGSLFRLKTGVQGMPTFTFGG
jgi:sugar lactone lactonase YvrE